MAQNLKIRLRRAERKDKDNFDLVKLQGFEVPGLPAENYVLEHWVPTLRASELAGLDYSDQGEWMPVEVVD